MNFEIEVTGTNSLFFIDRENGRGYYVENISLHKLSLLEEREVYIEKLVEIGYYQKNDAFFSKVSKNRWQNSLFPELRINETKLFVLLIALYFLLLSITFFLFINFPLLTDLKYSPKLMDYIITLVIFYSGIYLIHEYFHVIIAKIQGIEIRKIGFKIKYFLFPIAYVQFMPTSRDRARANIAFAGNVADLFLLITYYLIYLHTNFVQLYFVLFFQLVMTFWNYNIFLPTDFLLFILSYFKKPSFRVKALKFTKKYVLGLITMSYTKIDRKEIMFLIYGICNYLFFAYIVYSIIKGVLNVF
ncbi:hypothetical protein ACS60E_03140 [Streptococcus suis]